MVVENSDYSEFSLINVLDFVNILHKKWQVSQFFGKIIPNVPEFWEYSAR